jgi:GT2 family glycosyltransferase
LELLESKGLSQILVSIAIPTLAADSRLRECLVSLDRQTLRDFEVIVIDNSGSGAVARLGLAAVRVIQNPHNVGFGTAINQALAASSAPYLATLNDDAVAHPGWLEALVETMQQRPEAGMCASQVRFYGEPRLDSAAMLMAADGSSKQRGHGKPPEDFPVEEETLFPSGSAALYRRGMLEDLGGFDDAFFLYCEDTDLGLRARWAGWKCWYVPHAVVEHHYSHSAGDASPLKAYYVERNRLFVVAKNFPLRMLIGAPFASVMRYFWHIGYLIQGKGSAARFRAGGNSPVKMLRYVVCAHAALLWHGRRLWRERRRIRSRARITPPVFRHLIRGHFISTRRVAAL